MLSTNLSGGKVDNSAKIRAILTKPEFPRSAKYEADWVLDNQMGPSAIWLTEWLCEKLQPTKGMRVLDLGCGRAMSSIFLAREFGARVWAADLWISPDTNWKRVVEAGCADSVCPLRCEAHAIPFAEGFFDAVVSIDCYQYFGTDDLYIDYLGRFVRPGGTIAVVVPGLMQPFSGGVPRHLTEPQANGKAFWEPTCRCFKTREFWRELWQGSATVEAVETDSLQDGWRHWRDLELALEASGKGIFPPDREALEADGGRYIGFHRVVARRTGTNGVNIYDPNLGKLVGVDE
jgi:SAM-dependent methyltransferase